MSNFFQRFKKKKSNDISKSPSWGAAENGTVNSDRARENIREQEVLKVSTN